MTPASPAAPGTAGGAQEAATQGQAARKAWGEHWATATQRGRGKPGYDSLAYEAEAWEVAAAAAWAPERDRLNAALAELDRLRIAGADLRRHLDDLASRWERVFVHAGCARELRDALKGGGE